MRRGINYLFYLVVVLLLIALPSLVRWARFNTANGPDAAEPPVYQPAGLAEFAPTPAAAPFVDEAKAGDGLVLLDLAHDNRFDVQEIGYLDSRLAARGYELVGYQEGNLANALRPVNAFITIAPMTSFTTEEIQAVTDFLDRGGRLFMAGDPTRFRLEFEDDFEDLTPLGYRVESDQLPLNSLANEFDLNYLGDYVYNTVESEGNYRNIIIPSDGFAPDRLTVGLDKVAFYGSHSLQVENDALALLKADDDTYSSATDRPGGLVLAALAHNGQVLAVGDIDFLSEPYFNVFDNSRFIAQIANFLAHDERSRTLADFPYFFGDEIDLVYTGDPELGPDTFDEIIAWQAAFRDTGRTLTLTGEPARDHDTLYVGLYNQADEVTGYLTAEGITLLIEPPIQFTESAVGGEPDGPSEPSEGVDAEESNDSEEEAEKAPESSADDGAEDSSASEDEEPEIRTVNSDLGIVHMAGTALILLTEELGRPKLVILTASAEGLESTIDRLIALMPAGAEQTLADCLLQGNLALCPTNVADEVVEAELLTGGTPAQAQSGGDEEEDESIEEAEPARGSNSESEEEEPGSIIHDAELQGDIHLDETLEVTLEPNTAHAWAFSEGPTVVNIILVPGDPIDGILELYGPDGELLGAVDSAFTVGEERLEFTEIPDDQEYIIVVRDFFEEGGDYTLSVIAVTPEDLDAIDQGSLTDGQPVQSTLEDVEVHSWTFTIDTPAVVNITLTSGSDLDGLLVLFDPDNRLITIADDGLAGDEERIEELPLDDLGEYTVVVAGYSFGGGSYSLLLELSQ